MRLEPPQDWLLLEGTLLFAKYQQNKAEQNGDNPLESISNVDSDRNIFSPGVPVATQKLES